MRLSKVKLAGFKSFVDPTTLQFPSALTGVVGPNGCGKSNIIDAVRWVMGESSAKNLRGDSMADVIFNGSTSRKPVGHASIELTFDNADGSVGGQYANYNEIAIRRQVSRDGQSVYFLNGTRCRRRDITDIFLGTGLGPRSYSIIEQGMISRLIEAKPEELRVFLEEAAGISKYKERRRETENRIRHTRENLDRLADLREEIEKNLERLQRQAKAAEKYKELKAEERRLKAELLALRYQALQGDSEQRERDIAAKQNSLEAVIAEQRALEAAIEKARAELVEANEAFGAVQEQYYEIGSEVARVEQAIQHCRDTHKTQQEELVKAESAWSEAQSHIDTDTTSLAELSREIAEVTPGLESAKEENEAARDALKRAESSMQTWQSAWEGFNRDSADAAQKAQVERTRIDHLDRHLNQVAERLEKIQAEQQTLTDNQLDHQISELSSALESAGGATAERQSALADQVEQVNTLRETVRRCTTAGDDAQNRLESLRGRLTTLEALQQAALGEQNETVREWLTGQSLGDAPRLATRLKVESGWERAAETVLGSYLEAVCVDGVKDVAAVIGSLDSGAVSFVERAAASVAPVSGYLAARVECDWDVSGLFAGVRSADNLQQALAMRSGLKPGESVVTADGVWVGPGWLRVARDVDEKSGILEREKEIKELRKESHKLEEELASHREALEKARTGLQATEDQRDDAQVKLTDAHREEAAVRANLTGLSVRLEQLQKRQEAVTREAEQLVADQSRNGEELRSARQALQEHLTVMERLSDERAQREGERESLLKALDQARETAREIAAREQSLAIRAESLRTAISTTELNLERMQAQQKHLQSRRDELKSAIAEAEAPIDSLTAELNKFLTRRVSIDESLAAARRKVETIEAAVRESEQHRADRERSTQETREAINEARMAWQEVKVRGDTLMEQLAETDLTLETLLEDMPEEADVETWEQRAVQYENRIQRLGSINMAAIEEYDEQSERKVYLDAQFDDVTEALQTLENAIHKIDKETRTRFKETFDKVNSGLQNMFPRLFGGGHAYLELVGDDLLDTGVTVMARPPGKRNSTIHLLSGGEKALTAVAMVFSIFELNPSPFCILDEVDAPLDDANVGRFCDMVREMSSRVQFIFITHNKITMELAECLNGVTMSEPGVSRLVSVDVDEAVQMAAS